MYGHATPFENSIIFCDLLRNMEWEHYPWLGYCRQSTIPSSTTWIWAWHDVKMSDLNPPARKKGKTAESPKKKSPPPQDDLMAIDEIDSDEEENNWNFSKEEEEKLKSEQKLESPIPLLVVSPCPWKSKK